VRLHRLSIAPTLSSLVTLLVLALPTHDGERWWVMGWMFDTTAATR
jgi:hypothetical protein